MLGGFYLSVFTEVAGDLADTVAEVGCQPLPRSLHCSKCALKVATDDYRSADSSDLGAVLPRIDVTHASSKEKGEVRGRGAGQLPPDVNTAGVRLQGAIEEGKENRQADNISWSDCSDNNNLLSLHKFSYERAEGSVIG